MTLLHITPSYKPAFYYGGPTLSVSHLCETLAGQGHRVEVLTTTANGPAELPVSTVKPVDVDGVRVRYFPRWTGDHSHFSPALLWRVWRRCRHYDAVHVHSWWNTVALLSVLICRLRGLRPVVSPRGMLSPYTLRSRAKGIFHRLIGKFLLQGTIVHATSVQEQRELSALIPGVNTCCLPNLVPLPPFQTAAPAERGYFHILFLGRIDPKKGLEVLLKTLPLLKMPYRLTIAGSGAPAYEAGLRRLAEGLGITGRLLWTGWVEGAQKQQLLAEADVFVLPSHNENFANAALEALAMGTPVVLSDQVGLADYVRQSGFGRVCPAREDALADALGALAENNPAQDRPSIAERVRQDFDPARLAQAYVEVYRTLDD